MQREAAFALRAAPAPVLPSGLLDRLRALPSTAPLPFSPLALDPTGAAVFPAYGTVQPEPSNDATMDTMTHERRRSSFASDD